MSYLWMVYNGQTKCFPNWFNGCDNLYTIKILNYYFHMLKAFKWHYDGGSHNCKQNIFLMMYMCAYVHGCICSTLCFYWTKYKMNNSNMSQPHFGAKCENATHIPKSGKMESFGTLEASKDDLRGQISSHWCVLYINGKILKCKCPKWPRMGHLDICSQVMGKRRAESQTVSLTPDH
jgi:hypothetical protein